MATLEKNKRPIFAQRLDNEYLRRKNDKEVSSEEDFADLLDIGYDAYRSYTKLKPKLKPDGSKVNGYTMPGLSVAVQIARNLNVSLDYLSGRYEDEEEIEQHSVKNLLYSLYALLRNLPLDMYKDKNGMYVITTNNSYLQHFLDDINEASKSQHSLSTIIEKYNDCHLMDRDILSHKELIERLQKEYFKSANHTMQREELDEYLASADSWEQKRELMERIFDEDIFEDGDEE